MKYEVVTRDSCSVVGLQVALTTSQSENQRIIAEHWKRFNRELRVKSIKLDGDWVKYGIINKDNGQYTYLTAIPKVTDFVGFTEVKLNGGRYVQFEHRGNMGLLKSTIHSIYKKIIPEVGFDIDSDRAMIPAFFKVVVAFYILKLLLLLSLGLIQQAQQDSSF